MVAAARDRNVPWKALEAELEISGRQLSRYLRAARRVPGALRETVGGDGDDGQEGAR